MRVAGGRRAGRSHRRHDVPCQDAYAWVREPDGTRVAAAVADGLGSRPLSHLGSRAACEAAVLSLGSEPSWDAAAVFRAFEAARRGIEAAAREEGAAPNDLAATLQVVGLTKDEVVAAIVGDGAVIACDEGVHVLLGPEESEYANEVAPITHPEWGAHFRFARLADAKSAFVFTDGLTRLLLARADGGWGPFAPFFEAFLPKLSEPNFDEDIVERFLAGDNVDASWDDDKCLVVVARDR